MMESDYEGRQIVLDLQVQCKNLGPNANPVCGLFAIDQSTGQLVFLSHTEVMRAAPNPKFAKFLTCNYYPGRNQKLQFNIYSAPWKDNEVDNSIHEEDRIGSIIIAMDKVVPMNALDSKNFAPISVELPLWHDTDPVANDKLQALGSGMKISFKCSDNQPDDIGPVGPKADQNIHQALAIMLRGDDFLKYPFGSSGAPQKRFVWYDKKDGPMGTIYWCDTGKQKKKKDKCIPVNTVTGLFEQNQTDAFRKYRKLPKERMNRCFSIVGKERTLDLEAKSKEIVDAWMTGIHRILSGSGFGVKEVTAQDADEMMSQVVVNNTFMIKAKLRNLPPMPWSHDESNDTMINMEEKLPNAQKFKAIEQTEWQKGNSNPNFEKELLLPFTIPPTNHPIKFTVFDHQMNEKHLMGASVVRLDFFYRYASQEMMVKLRNAHDPKIDALLCEANAYMLLTADPKNAIEGMAVGAGTRSNFNNVIDEFKNRTDGVGSGDGTGMRPSRLRPFFTRSTLAFMTAGCAVTVWSENDKMSGHAQLFFRSIEPFGQIVLCNEKSGDVNGMDSKGNPKDPLLTMPMDWITECRMGVTTGQFSSDKKKKAKAECCMSILYKAEGKEDGIIQSIDLELRDPGTRDAWATGIQEYISSVLEGNEGEGDDDLFSFIKGGPKRGGGGIAGGKKLTDSVNASEEAAVGESLQKKFAPDDISKLGKTLLADDDDEDVSGIDLFGKDPERKKKNKVVLNPDDVTVSGDGAPPAPPLMVVAPDIVMGSGAPPPPPGPPGAPPMAPGMGPGIPKYNGPKLKHIHWEVLAPSDGAEGTLWALLKDDLDKEGSKMIEELFKAADLKAMKKSEEKEEDKGIRLLDAKRANNIEIVLKSFRMPNNAIRDAILQVDTTILTLDKIQALLSMVPTPDEKKALKAFVKSGKDVAKLGTAEQFALYMLEVDKVDMRLRLLLFQSKYDQIVDEMTQQYTRLIAAGEKVKDSKQLIKVMETILSVGNKLNAGTRTGGATGFRLAALDKLNDTKSADNKQTLLDFIVEYVDKAKKSEDERFPDPDPKDVDAGINLPSYLDSISGVKDAALIDWQALNTERETLMHGLQELTKEVEEMASKPVADGDRFPQVMQVFLEHALKKAKKMKKKYLDAQELIEGLFEFFGENENSFEPTEFFKLFDRFFINYKASELKMFQKRLRAKREQTRKETAANKPASSSSSSAPVSGPSPVNNIAAVMAARRAQLEAAGSKSPDDDGWEEEQKKPSSPAPPAEAKQPETKPPTPSQAAGETVAASAQ